MAPAGLTGLPAGSYGCRVDGTRQFMSNLSITTAGMYTGGYQFGTQDAPLTYDSTTGKVTFLSGDYFTAPGFIVPHHFVGQYPSTFSGDPAGTILLSEVSGYPNDSTLAPAIQGSTSGLWHCTPTSVSGVVSPATTVPASRGNAMSIPFGVYIASGYNSGLITYIASMRMRSDGTYSMAPSSGNNIPNPDTGQSGTYKVTSTSVQFLTGPYAGCAGGFFPNWKGSTRTYIDVLYQGTTTDYEFSHA